MQTNSLMRLTMLASALNMMTSVALAQTPEPTAPLAEPNAPTTSTGVATGSLEKPLDAKPATGKEATAKAADTSGVPVAPAVKKADPPTLSSTLNIKEGAELTLKEIVDGCSEPTNAVQPYCMLSCVYTDVICVNETGTPIPSEVVPATVEPNTTLRVVVIATDSSKFPTLVLTETVGDMPFPRISKALTMVRDLRNGWFASTIAYTMAKDATTERLDFSLDDKTTSTLVIRSNGGYHFVSVGAGLIIPTSGAPRIATLNPPDGSGARFEVTRDAKLRPALVLRVYPLGHRAQALSPFSGPWPANSGNWRKAGVALRDLLSFEAGVNLEPARMTERVLVGIGLEPVTGLSFSWGVRIDQAERFRNGFSNGAFVTANRADAVESYLSVGQYFGVSINQHIYDLLSQGYSAFAGQSQSP